MIAKSFIALSAESIVRLFRLLTKIPVPTDLRRTAVNRFRPNQVIPHAYTNSSILAMHLSPTIIVVASKNQALLQSSKGESRSLFSIQGISPYEFLRIKEL